ncbi:MAG: transposase, partial [Acidobacteriota bacterium]|nr:transposase [Acidobacteriota bacterium]
MLAIGIEICQNRCMIKNTSPILKALRLAANDEKSAVEFLERERWGSTPACPRCGSVEVYQMTG